MKQIYCTTIVLLLLSACSNQGTNGRLKKETIASGMDGVDSLLQVNWKLNEEETFQPLFYIACGGDLEYLTDTLIHNDLGGDFAVISIADYFQEHQLFYIVYDIRNNQLKQSKRIYIPNWGIFAFSEIQINNVTMDSLFLKTSTGMTKTVKLEPLVYNQHGIINYYEFE